MFKIALSIEMTIMSENLIPKSKKKKCLLTVADFFRFNLQEIY